MVVPLTRLSMETAMVIGKPAPFVSAFVDAVDEAIREHSPSYGMSTMQRAWLAFCVTAVLITNSICWARFERASLGTYSLAALSWMFRHREPFGITRYYTDGWGAYERHIDADKHQVGKDNTQKIESKHINLRTRIKRLVRRTICFSKTDHMHDLVIGLFINRYEFGRAL